MKRLLAAFFMLLLFGAARQPLEISLNEEHRAAFFRGAKLDLKLREQIGQGAFIAALSGFRSLVADMLWIQANTAWENVQWGRMKLLFDSVTTLQPRVVMFWDMAAWHMAWNASVAARENPKQPREALRVKAEREYWQIGREYLEAGIRNNPDRYTLYDRLGFLLREKFKDHLGSAQAYGQAAKFKDALSYEKRFAAYELSYCPGKEAEAHAELLRLYNLGKNEWLPTLLLRLQAMEDKLNIPSQQRVYIPPKFHQ